MSIGDVAEYRYVLNPAALERAGLFVAEGRFIVQRLLAQPRFRVRSILVTPAAAAALSGNNQPVSVPVHIVDQAVLDSAVGFNMHRGCVALAERPRVRMLEETRLQALDRVVVLEGVSNPDNIGGIFRSAAAFGVQLVVLGPGCGDPYYRKAIRTSMAATLDVPFVSAGEWPAALTVLSRAGLRVMALTTSPKASALTSIPPGMERPSERLALLLGAEGAGLTPAAVAVADERVRIRTTVSVDSLNVTVAASIAMHHMFAH